MSRRGFARLAGAGLTPCALCDRTRMEHVLGHEATTRHAFITRTAYRKMAPLERLRLATEYSNGEHPLPRCEHGSALRDHSGEALEPTCGCRP